MYLFNHDYLSGKVRVTFLFLGVNIIYILPIKFLIQLLLRVTTLTARRA